MSREIKFRAWDESSKEMFNIHGNVGFSLSGEMKMPVYNSEGMVVDLPLMQLTGLTDCNGVDIYESDIVKGMAEDEGQSEVFYDYGQWQPFSYLGNHCGQHYKVIGNIHQNPELLK